MSKVSVAEMQARARVSGVRRGLIYGFPARRNRNENPYNLLMSDALERRGWRVVDPAPLAAITTIADVVHVHWPQQVASVAGSAFVRRTAFFVLVLIVQKLFGTKLVWTAHNVTSHSARRPKLEAALMALVTRLLDGVVYLGERGRDATLAAFPRLADVPSRVVAHGVYGSTYPPSPTQTDARALLGIDTAVDIVGFIGDIRPYKGLDRLLAATTEASTYELLVAGAVPKDRYGESIISAIAALRKRGCTVHLIDRRLNDQELVTAIAASSVIVFPYTTDSMSGMAILAAERGRYLAAPSSRGFDDLQEQLGGKGVARVNDFAPASMSQVLQLARGHSQADTEAFVDRNNWDSIAATIDDLYDQLRSTPGGRPRR